MTSDGRNYNWGPLGKQYFPLCVSLARLADQAFEKGLLSFPNHLRATPGVPSCNFSHLVVISPILVVRVLSMFVMDSLRKIAAYGQALWAQRLLNRNSEDSGD